MPPLTITIDGVEFIRKADAPPVVHDGHGYVIVRCKNAGVHAGYVKERKEGVLTLTSSRRLWRWWSKATLSELAMEGPLPAKMSEQKYGCTLPVLHLTESDVCEVIPCTNAACVAIMGVPVWVA